MADLHVPIRAGTDIAFLGGLIRHVLETESYFKEYVLAYTNASTIINEKFQDTEDLGGYFSGFDEELGTYDPQTWMYEGGEIAASAGRREHSAQSFEAPAPARACAPPRWSATRRSSTRAASINLLRRHFSRYTPEMVERICGISPEQFHRVARDADRQLRPRAHHRALLRRRLDAAHRGRADDPRRGDPAAAAGQHRPSGRRGDGAARPRHDPGLDGHPDALRPAAGLPAHAARARGGADARGLRGHGRLEDAAGGRTSTSTSCRC